MPQSLLKTLRVRAGSGARTRGLLTAGPQTWPVALGRGGILADKRQRGLPPPGAAWSWSNGRLRDDAEIAPAPALESGRRRHPDHNWLIMLCFLSTADRPAGREVFSKSPERSFGRLVVEPRPCEAA